MICKHLCACFEPVTPSFFRTVKRFRTSPYWRDNGLVIQLQHRQPAPLQQEVDLNPMAVGAEIYAASDDEADIESSVFEESDFDQDDFERSEPAEEVREEDVSEDNTEDLDIRSVLENLEYLKDMIVKQAALRNREFIASFNKNYELGGHINRFTEQARILGRKRNRDATWSRRGPLMYLKSS